MFRQLWTGCALGASHVCDEVTSMLTTARIAKQDTAKTQEHVVEMKVEEVAEKTPEALREAAKTAQTETAVLVTPSYVEGTVEQCSTFQVTNPADVMKFNASKDKILLFAAPKTASTTLREIFRLPHIQFQDADINYDRCHWERSQPLVSTHGRCADLLRHRCQPGCRAHSSELAGSFLRENPDATTFIIVPMRHFLTRGLSNFFQAGGFTGDEDPNVLLQEFWEAWPTPELFGTSYVERFERDLGINLGDFATQADFSTHHGLFLQSNCRGRRIVTLIIRVEDIESWKVPLGHFFHKEDLHFEKDGRFPRQWTADAKPYNQLYLEVRELFKQHASRRFCQNMSDWCDMSAFYKPEEISKFIASECRL